MRSTIPLGRVAGIPVGMHWSALIGMVLLGQLVALTVLPATAPGLGAAAYWLAGGIAALGLGGSLLTHELAHAIVARRTGLTVRRITLWLLGGASELAGQPSEPGAEVRIALVGPVTSLGLGGLLGAAAVVTHNLGVPAGVVATLSWLASMNILLGVFNLLPGTPLDGGGCCMGCCGGTPAIGIAPPGQQPRLAGFWARCWPARVFCWPSMVVWMGCGCCWSAGSFLDRPPRSARPLSSWGG